MMIYGAVQLVTAATSTGLGSPPSHWKPGSSELQAAQPCPPAPWGWMEPLDDHWPIPFWPKAWAKGIHPQTSIRTGSSAITDTGVIGADFEDTAGGVNRPAWGTTTVPTRRMASYRSNLYRFLLGTLSGWEPRSVERVSDSHAQMQLLNPPAINAPVCRQGSIPRAGWDPVISPG